MVTNFAATLRCPHCGHDSYTEMYTKLLDAPGIVTVRVGDAVDADPMDYVDAFHQLRERRPDEPFRVFLPWLCRQCGWGNWALVTIADERVQSIEDVPLNRDSLPLAQFITYNLRRYFKALTGEDLYRIGEDQERVVRDDFAALLAVALPGAPGRAPSFEDL